MKAGFTDGHGTVEISLCISMKRTCRCRVPQPRRNSTSGWWGWSLHIMTPPETSSFCALVKARGQCWAFGVRRAYERHGHKCHLAFAVTLPELLAAGKRLNDLGFSLATSPATKRLSLRSLAGCRPDNFISMTPPVTRLSLSLFLTINPTLDSSGRSPCGKKGTWCMQKSSNLERSALALV